MYQKIEKKIFAAYTAACWPARFGSNSSFSYRQLKVLKPDSFTSYENWYIQADEQFVTKQG